ncbi:unnamed protein product [Candida verbasci]|uniref:Oxidant-induced cell-cycle arrest protein 5 n=1 Tax=Candida verbasci TaxID=1227364 RepID=A0A9W4U0K8_9ASCO|nr:unnamed protein product [Candida verbasci]
MPTDQESSTISLNTSKVHLNPNSHNKLNGHQRNESSNSRSYSFLDYYGAESPPQISSGSTTIKKINGLDTESESIDPSTSLDVLDLKDDTLCADGDVINNSKSLDSEHRENYIQPINMASKSEILKSNFDRYGFKKGSTLHNITMEDYNEWFNIYSDSELRQLKKWHLLMKHHGFQIEENNNEEYIPTRFPPRSDKVKKMIRKGIPSSWRGNAWFFYAGGYDKLNKNTGVYEKIVANTRGIKNKDTEVIERDLNRTFPDNIYFNSNLSNNTDLKEEPNLIKSLRRVLIAFAHYQPQIGYCQSLNFLAGLLLIFMTEERTFWMLVILTEKIIPKVHSQNLEGVHTDQGVLILCIKEYIPSLWNILGKNFDGEPLEEDKILIRLPPITLVTSSWFMSLFVGILPIETVLRIWDILWYEGSKTIFRFSLTIFKLCLDSPDFQMNSQNGSSETEQIELFQFMQSFPKKLLDSNLLIDCCFKKIGGYGFGSLSQDEINRCRSFVSKQREKINQKNKNKSLTEMTDEEKTLIGNDIHDIYGFNRSIMSGMVWNKNIRKKLSSHKKK